RNGDTVQVKSDRSRAAPTPASRTGPDARSPALMRSFPLIIATVLAAAALAGCSATEAGTASDAAPGSPGYPLTISNCGVEVTVDAPPQRAVALNQGS